MKALKVLILSLFTFSVLSSPRSEAALAIAFPGPGFIISASIVGGISVLSGGIAAGSFIFGDGRMGWGGTVADRSVMVFLPTFILTGIAGIVLLDQETGDIGFTSLTAADASALKVSQSDKELYNDSLDEISSIKESVTKSLLNEVQKNHKMTYGDLAKQSLVKFDLSLEKANIPAGAIKVVKAIRALNQSKK